MKNIKEKEIQGLEIFCSITALATAVLSVMFLFDFWQNHWFLNFILGLGVLLNLALLLLFLLRHKIGQSVTTGLLMLFYIGALVFFNLIK